MSQEWGSEKGFTQEQLADLGTRCFRRGAQVMRELILRRGGVPQAVRDDWMPDAWGNDPRRPTEADFQTILRRFNPFDELP